MLSEISILTRNGIATHTPTVSRRCGAVLFGAGRPSGPSGCGLGREAIVLSETTRHGRSVIPMAAFPLTTITDPCPVPSASCKAGKTPTIDLSAQPIPRPDGQAGHFEESGGLQTTIPAGGSVGVGDGWYSYNLGAWHLISLNIEATQPGGCSDTGSWFGAELAWLKRS